MNQSKEENLFHNFLFKQSATKYELVIEVGRAYTAMAALNTPTNSNIEKVGPMTEVWNGIKSRAAFYVSLIYIQFKFSAPNIFNVSMFVDRLWQFCVCLYLHNLTAQPELKWQIRILHISSASLHIYMYSLSSLLPYFLVLPYSYNTFTLAFLYHDIFHTLETCSLM